MLRRAAATATAVVLIGLLGGLLVHAEDYAELHITGITLDPPSTITRGIDIEVHARVMNTGARNADQFGVGIFYRPVGFSGSWLLVDTVDDASLAASQEGFLDVAFTLETGELELGTYDVRVVADPMNQISEIDEFNNELQTTFTVIDSKHGLPDLQPTSLVFAPLNPESDDDMLPWNVTVVVENPADEQAGALTVAFLLDGVEFDRKFLFALPSSGATEVVGELDPFALGLLPGTYSISVVVDVDDQVIEQDEGNNSIGSALALQSPDVYPTSISFGKTVVRQDEEVRVSAEIRNGGAGTAKAVEVALYIDQIRFASTEIDLIGRGLGVSVEGILAPDVLGLDDAPSVHQIRVVVDPNDKLPELDEANNEMIRTLTILEPALQHSELHLESVELSPASPIELGRTTSLTVSTVVANTGRAAAEDFESAFYYRVKGALRWEPFSCVNGAGCQIASLASGAQTRLTAALPLALLSPGVYEIRVAVDPANAVGELDESNNALVTTVTLLAARLPDLSFCLTQPIAIAPSAQIHKGQTLRLDTCISNIGDADAEAFNVRFAYTRELQTADPTRPAAAPEFFSTYFSPNSEIEIPGLSIGGMTQVPVLLETHQLNPGLYSVRVEIDPATGADQGGRVAERDEVNNVSLLQVMVLGADLAVTQFTTAPENVVDQSVTESIEFFATVINGGMEAAGEFNVRFQLLKLVEDGLAPIRVFTCDGDGADCGGPLFFGEVSLPGIGVFVPEHVQCSLDLAQADLEPGQYIARIAVDCDGVPGINGICEGRVAEHDETNNVFDLPIVIVGERTTDLTAAAFERVEDPDLHPSFLRFAATIENLGIEPAGAFDVLLRVYQLPDPTQPDIPEVLRHVEILSVPGLGGYATQDLSWVVDFSQVEMAPGAFDVRIDIDCSGQFDLDGLCIGGIAESNEMNNASELSLEHGGDVSPGAGRADLWIEKLNAAEVAGDAGMSHLWATITNLGDVVSGAFDVMFYYVPTPGGSPVGLAGRQVMELGPGRSTTVLRTIDTSAWAPGYYDVRIVVDPENEILELNETNNSKDEELRIQ